MWEPAERLKTLPAYVFSQINLWKEQARGQGRELLSLAIGDPDLPTPPELLEVMERASRNPASHAYSPYEGTLAFRQAAAQFLQDRFGVSVDPGKEVLALIGSKEGVAHFPISFCNPGDRVLYPSPGYPIFETAPLLAGARAIPLPHRAENQFLPDPAELEALLQEHRPRLLILNFPSNPTAALISLEGLTTLVELARRFHCAIAYDNAYSELYYSKDAKPVSILQVPGASEIGIEFHSLSKTFNMTGWRLGFAVGNPQLIQMLLRLKTHIDSGPLLAVQEMGSYALHHADRIADPLREIYRERKKVVAEGLARAGIEYCDPKATFFVWCKVPGQEGSMEFVQRLIFEKGLVVTPGVGFGRYGEGFFRLALTSDNEALRRALARLS